MIGSHGPGRSATSASLHFINLEMHPDLARRRMSSSVGDLPLPKGYMGPIVGKSSFASLSRRSRTSSIKSSTRIKVRRRR